MQCATYYISSLMATHIVASTLRPCRLRPPSVAPSPALSSAPLPPAPYPSIASAVRALAAYALPLGRSFLLCRPRPTPRSLPTATHIVASAVRALKDRVLPTAAHVAVVAGVCSRAKTCAVLANLRIRRRNPLRTATESGPSTSPYSGKVSSRVSTMPSPPDLLANSCRRRRRRHVQGFQLSSLLMMNPSHQLYLACLAPRLLSGFALSTTAAALRCAASYLEMIEEFAGNNLISLAERFLSHSVFSSPGESVKALKSCEALLPLAEELGIPQCCIDAVVVGACSGEPSSSLFGWPVMDDSAVRQRNDGTQLSSWAESLTMNSEAIELMLTAASPLPMFAFPLLTKP
ncbi:BTB/POZ domain-containing protein [Apostasia shenzhenica]|uniref:BTB/POZ domain-containing protein n=1 Tax=Apostasia shenzhenica TaxID=1088818 RepID=A0A2H9ZX01_9ASPA|nr:BTB/POZ domain-containing protein [Apostasia shenzhenica]